MQALPYVCPSQPHTGANSKVQSSGFGAQAQGASARPQSAPSGKAQKLPSSHSPRPREPQAGPLGGLSAA
jgi:hypothetical protein